MEPVQDWEKVIIRKKSGSSSKQPAAAPGSQGAKKFGAGLNPGTATGNWAKIDSETDELSHQTVGLGLGRAIQQARADKDMKQTDLAKQINVKPAIINQYERGKALPNGQLIARIEQVLGTKLPRPSKK